ncbi:MAG: hypothetical protein IT541_09585 [Hyphomicrobiales bacterium]|jgi:hypothetical protein|nr:hypothetical protein [Hyphomicrobiales bacterium]
MIRIELNPSADRWKEADMAIHTDPDSPDVLSGDVCTFCSERSCERPNPSTVLARPLSQEMLAFADRGDGVRAMVGNAGCELTFRHLEGSHARRNITRMLRWAMCSYTLLRRRLVLAPMDLDLIHDVMTGRQFLEWASTHRVPLVIFCGYRFLFHGDAFEHIRQVDLQHPFNQAGNPFKYPFSEISDAIRSSHAEVWTGAGFHEGLEAGTISRAERFGFSGVLTTRAAWEAAGFDQRVKDEQIAG